MFLPYSLLAAFLPPRKCWPPPRWSACPYSSPGLIFSRSFRDVAQPAQGLGINLLGAVVGGALENLVMVGGTPVLGVLAFLLYGLSAVFAFRLVPETKAAPIDPAHS